MACSNSTRRRVKSAGSKMPPDQLERLVKRVDHRLMRGLHERNPSSNKCVRANKHATAIRQDPQWGFANHRPWCREMLFSAPQNRSIRCQSQHRAAAVDKFPASS